MRTPRYSTLGGSCTYSGTTPGAPCSISCRGTAATPTTITSTIVPNATGVQEIGELDTVIDLHYSGVQNSNGAAASNGPAIQCSGTAAAAVQSCAVGAFCDTTVTINGTASGIGATVTFPPGKIFGASTPYPISCGARPCPLPHPHLRHHRFAYPATVRVQTILNAPRLLPSSSIQQVAAFT